MAAAPSREFIPDAPAPSANQSAQRVGSTNTGPGSPSLKVSGLGAGCVGARIIRAADVLAQASAGLATLAPRDIGPNAPYTAMPAPIRMTSTATSTTLRLAHHRTVLSSPYRDAPRPKYVPECSPRVTSAATLRKY